MERKRSLSPGKVLTTEYCLGVDARRSRERYNKIQQNSTTARTGEEERIEELGQERERDQIEN